MSAKIIKFIYKASFEKQPKKLHNNVFVLYSPKRIKLRPGEVINVDRNCLSIYLKKLLQHAYFYQCLLKMDFVWKAINKCHQTTTKTTFAMRKNLLTRHGKYILNLLIEVQILFFSICKKQELCFCTILKDGVEELKVKHTKTQTFF